MPRDSSGTYTLPPSNPVIDGTLIETLWANPTMQDIAAQLNNLITRDGLLGATAPIGFYDGTAALPGITFAAQPNTGFYRAGAGSIGVSSSGTNVATFAPTGTVVTGTFRVVSGADSGEFYNNVNGFGIEAKNAKNLFFVTNGLSHMILDTAGRLGIGIAPVAQLHVLAPLGVPNYLALDTTVAAGGYAAFQVNGVSKGYIGSAGQLAAGGNANDLALRAETDLVFATGGNVEHMRINAAGSVGIGTAPAARLHVATNTLNVLTLDSSNASGGFTTYAVSGVSKGFIGAAAPLITGTNVNDFGFRAEADMVFAAGGANERMRITAAGNVNVAGGLTATGGLTTQFQTLRGPAGSWRQISFNTNNLARWAMYANGTPESGGNAGSDFAIDRYNDAGTFIDTPFFIGRNTGNVSIANKLFISNSVNITSAGGAETLVLTDTGASGANIKLVGSGATNPNKHIRAYSGNLEIINSAYNAVLLSIDDGGSVGIGMAPGGFKLQVSTPNLPVALFDTTNASGGFCAYSINQVTKGYVGIAGPLVTGGTANDFCIRAENFLALAAGGSTARVFVSSLGISPAADNTYSCGISGSRWSVVYAATGTINTSDAREKTEVRPLRSNELDAAMELAREIGAFKWLKAVEEKGDAARIHIGMTVQRAIEVMESHGLDPFAYGFICHDLDPDTYSFRHDELLLFLAAGFEERLSRLEERV